MKTAAALLLGRIGLNRSSFNGDCDRVGHDDDGDNEYGGDSSRSNIDCYTSSSWSGHAHQMGAGAEEAGITLQYCMSLPR